MDKKRVEEAIKRMSPWYIYFSDDRKPLLVLTEWGVKNKELEEDLDIVNRHPHLLLQKLKECFPFSEFKPLNKERA